MRREFDDLVDTEGLDAGEVRRLRHVHDMLEQAGPPPELPPELATYVEPAPDSAKIAQFPLLPRRRLAAAVVLAAALGVAAFGGGYLLADHKSDAKSFEPVRVIPMRGPHGALASIQMGKRDSVGNWEMLFSVTGLPQQRQPAYYNLYLVKGGKPVVLCGSFRVNDKTTTLKFSVPYNARRFEGWVVTEQKPPFGKGPGPVVLTT